MTTRARVRETRDVETRSSMPFTELIESVERTLAQSLAGVEPVCLREAMAYSLCGGGKRIRPVLCLATFGMYSSDLRLALPTACALEMLHAATLIHDDLPAMDDDDFRRGSPANHKVFGEGMALLAGDALLAYSLEFILERTTDLGADRLLAVMSQLIRVVGPSGLSGGQALDLDCQGRTGVSRETVERMHLQKTGALIEASVVTGALLGGADREDVMRLAGFARDLGLAYQIVDDVLDETSTFDLLGKETHHDRDLAKWTYPRAVGVEQSRARASELVEHAVTALAPFGRRATPLRWAADEVLRRAAA